MSTTQPQFLIVGVSQNMQPLPASGSFQPIFPGGAYGQMLVINNTPYGLVFGLGGIPDVIGYNVPAGSPRIIVVRRPVAQIYYAVTYTQAGGVSNAPVNDCRIEFFDLDDKIEAAGLGSMGSQVGVSTLIASQLGNADEGIQAVGLPVHGVATSTDQFGPYSTTANANRTLQLGVLINGVFVGLMNLVNDKSANFQGALNVLNNLGLAPYSFQVSNGATGLDGNKITTDGSGNFNAIGNIGAVGLGVAAERAKGDGIHITTTAALQTIATLTTPNDGLRHTYRVSARMRVNNGTSGNNIVLRCAYTDFDSGTAVVVWFSGNGGSADVTFGGGSSVLNGVFSCTDRRIDCAPNTAITIQYTDPTNTPNDNVSGTIEQLS